MENIVLLGGGHQVNYSIDIILKENKYNIVGIIDSIHDIGTELSGYKVIGRQENIKELSEQHNIDGGIITIGDNWSRKIVHDCVIEKMPNFKFVNAIHPSVVIGNNVRFGVGIMIMAGCIINPNSVIENFCFLATGAQLEHDCVMKEFSSLSAGSVTGGKVTIGAFAAITLGVIILDRVTIGENTVVGSGSLVIKDLPENVLAFGNPAKIIRARQSGEKFLKST